MSFVMPFTINTVDFTISWKPWAHAREVCRTLEYGEKSISANIIKQHCNKKKQCTFSICTCKLAQGFAKISVHQLRRRYLCCFPVNSQKEMISEDTAAMCCFLMFYSNLETE